MSITQLSGGVFSSGLTNRSNKWRMMKEMKASFLPQHFFGVRNFSVLDNRNSFSYANAIKHCNLSVKHQIMLLSSHATRQRKRSSGAINSQLTSHCSVQSADVEESFIAERERDLSSSTDGVPELTEVHLGPSDKMGKKSTVFSSGQPFSQDVKRELIILSLPAMVGMALDPLAQLMETAYIGRLGSVELASAGVSVSIFNIISKLFNIPLLSVATSFVAEDISRNASEVSISGERQQLSSVSSALLLALGIGIFEAVALSLGSGFFLNLMGVSLGSSMRAPAQRFLILRALGAPAVVVSLCLQGIFRGFKDTQTPLLCLGIGNFSAVFLFPILMYYCRLGVTGAAISTVLSQYIVTFLMIWYLNKRAVLLPPKLRALQFGGYIKSGGFLIGRTLAVLTTTTLATSMAARQGPLAMAAHQICLQVWLAVSLLTDALAASAQALIASSFSKGDYETLREITRFVLKIGLVTGVSLTAVLGVSFSSLATMFTTDTEIIGIVRTGVLFVSASQPINALAFIFDGLHFGISDFRYAAQSMMLVSAISSAFLLYVPSAFGLPGVWLGLTLFMGLRTMAGYVRLSSKTGPWWFLHGDLRRSELAN